MWTGLLSVSSSCVFEVGVFSSLTFRVSHKLHYKWCPQFNISHFLSCPHSFLVTSARCTWQTTPTSRCTCRPANQDAASPVTRGAVAYQTSTRYGHFLSWSPEERSGLKDLIRSQSLKVWEAFSVNIIKSVFLTDSSKYLNCGNRTGTKK